VISVRHTGRTADGPGSMDARHCMPEQNPPRA